MSWYGDAMVAGAARAAPSTAGGCGSSPRRSARSRRRGARAGRIGRRLEKALALLADERLDALITDEVAFAALPAELPRLLAPGAPGLASVVRYE